MTFMGFIVLLAVAAICGAIGQSLAGYSLGGCFTSVVVGFIGAWLGPWIAHKLGFPLFYSLSIQGQLFPIVWSIIGSALFAIVVGALFRGRGKE